MPSSGCKTCARSEEHTSELQSHDNLVCRLLLEKKTRYRGGQAPPPHPTPPRRRAPPLGDARGGRRLPARGRGVLARPVFPAIFFFLSDAAPPEIYPLPLHDALPI